MFIESVQFSENGQTSPLRLMVKFIPAMIISYLLAKVLSSGLWQSHPALYHTAAESICNMINLAMFSIVWYTYERNSPAINFLGLSFLCATVLGLFHTLYSVELGLHPPGYVDLGSRYWILSRLIQSTVILTIALKIVKNQINKWIGLALALTLSISTSVGLLMFPGIMPPLYIPGYGSTLLKAKLEYFIIFLSMVSLYGLRKVVNKRDVLNYKYIFIALTISIATDLSFAFYIDKVSFGRVFGHLTKIAYYFYLLKGTVVSAVTYPYAKMEADNLYMARILNGLPIGVVTVNPHNDITFANLKIQQMLGRNPHESDNYSEKIMPLLRTIITDFSLGISHGEKNNGSWVTRITNQTGEEVSLRMERQTLYGDGSMYLLRDAKKEQELENLQLQTQAILKSVTNFVLIMDKNKRIVMCNKTFSDALQMEEHDLVGMEIRDFVHIFQSGSGNKEYKITAEGWLPEAHEASFINSSGEKREVVFHFGTVCNLEGELIGYTCVGVDVTKLKSEQQKLQQQEKLAVLGQMAAGIVHEIKNPLTAIKGFSQIIKTKKLDNQIRKYVDIIETEANGVNEVVSDFLAFAKPRPPVLKPMSINELINSMSLMLESELFIKGIALKIDLSPRERLVMADEGQIKQIILNIVRNAVDAVTGSQKPMIEIDTSNNETNREMNLVIIDNGKGISADGITKVGTPFYTTKDKGTGLGLSVCFQIVKQHGGRIDVQSELGQGTQIVIMLPCVN